MSWALAPANSSFAEFAFHPDFFRSLLSQAATLSPIFQKTKSAAKPRPNLRPESRSSIRPTPHASASTNRFPLADFAVLIQFGERLGDNALTELILRRASGCRLHSPEQPLLKPHSQQDATTWEDIC